MSLVRRRLIRNLVCPRYAGEDVTEAEVIELAESIKENGFIEALTAHREGTAIVIDDGKTRVLAGRYAGVKSVPVEVIDQRTGLPEVCEHNLLADCKRRGLRKTEKARAVKRLMDDIRLTAAEAGLRLGMSASGVNGLLALLDLPADVEAHVESGRITPRTAFRIAKVDDPQERSLLLQRTRDMRAKRN